MPEPTAEAGAGARPSPAALPQLALELRDLVVEYLRQETLVPLQKLGRYVLFGAVGSLLLGVGVLLLSMGALRALQTETGSTFEGDWSWAPYAIVVFALVVGAGLVWKARAMRAR